MRSRSSRRPATSRTACGARITSCDRALSYGHLLVLRDAAPADREELQQRIGFRETLRWFGSDLMEARPEYILEADRDKTIVHHVAEGVSSSE
jgi:hypothetical protein